MDHRRGKVVLLGEKGVGKSSLTHRLRHGEFTGTTQSTIGVAFVSHRLQRENKKVIIDIWDVAGHERFSHLLPMYLRNVQVALICFELPHTEKIRRLISITKKEDPKIQICLVATKVDLYGVPSGKYHDLTHPRVEKLAKEKELCLFYTSSLTDQGVQELFEHTADLILLQEPDSKADPEEDTLPLNSSQTHCCHT